MKKRIDTNYEKIKKENTKTSNEMIQCNLYNTNRR
jgi:hypothetical protein